MRTKPKKTLAKRIKKALRPERLLVSTAWFGLLAFSSCVAWMGVLLASA